MTSFSYAPISDEVSEIRLLTIQPGSGDDPLECQLQHAILDEKPTYEALSYTWGDSNDKRIIALDGFPWNVTANLECALRSLRQQDRPRTMWIDALCINQADLAEKSKQIPKMMDIYASASKVVAWLGPAGHDGNAAMEAIRDFADKLQGTEEEEMVKMGPEDLQSIGIDVGQIDWSSMWSFLNRPYWRRVWVLQELASCSHGTESSDVGDRGIIVCGSKSMPKMEFERFSKLLALLRFEHGTKFMDGDIEQEPLRTLRLATPSAIIMFLTYYVEFGLEYLLFLAPSFQASVPHDMVYGLLGLAAVEERALIIPDYEKPIKSVYADLYKALILHSKSLNCISYNRFGHYDQGASWIMNLGPRLTEGPIWTNGLPSSFRAATKVPIDFSFIEGTYHMALKGITVGVLDFVAGPCTDSGKALPLHLGDEQPDTCVDFENFLSQLVSSSQDLSADARESFWRTLVMDHDVSDMSNPITPAPEHFKQEFETLFGKKGLPEDYKPDLPLEVRKVDYALSSKFLKGMQDNTQNRCYFHTLCGKMGIGPYYSRQGDIVAALFGGERFFVLRPTSAGYKFIGDAYVQGGMWGEFVSAYLDSDGQAAEEFVLC